MLLGLSHIFFNRFFGWEQELTAVSLLTRRVFFVHNFFIGLVVVLGGAGSLFYTDALLRPGTLSRAILAGDDDVLVMPLASPVRRLRLRNLARRSVSHFHARSVLLAVVLRFGDIWNRVPSRKELTIYCVEAMSTYRIKITPAGYCDFVVPTELSAQPKVAMLLPSGPAPNHQRR